MSFRSGRHVTEHPRRRGGHAHIEEDGASRKSPWKMWRKPPNGTKPRDAIAICSVLLVLEEIDHTAGVVARVRILSVGDEVPRPLPLRIAAHEPAREPIDARTVVQKKTVVLV